MILRADKTQGGLVCSNILGGKKVQIIDVQCYTGRNIHSHRPVIKLTVDIGELYKYPTKHIEGFNDRLLELFPGLKRHSCSLGYEGGFLERLKEGTYIGHVTEHLIIEIQNMLGYKVSYGKTRVIEEPSLYYIVFEYVNEKCGIECARNSVDIIQNLIEKRSVDLDKILENLRMISIETDLGPSTRALYEEAKRRGIPVTRIGSDSLLRLGYGKYSRLVQAALTDMPSCISVDMACNKEVTKCILRDNKIPVPEGDVAYSIESAVQIAKRIGYPVVVKPIDLSQGKGVALNLNSESEVRSAFEEAKKYTKAVLVEKYIKGRDYRILVIGDRVAAAAERTPPFVKGDGVHTVRELVDIENASQLRGDCHEKPLTKIKLDSIAKKALEEQGIDETHIPLPEEKIFLRYNGNLSTGGTARNCTDELNPYNGALAVKAAKLLGLDIAGVDMTALDISKPVTGSNGAIIEVNAAPGLRMHLFPSEGEPVDVASDILDMMYPEGKESSIPIVSITGTNGKTTTTRLISHTLSLCGKRVGMTSTSGIYIGSECVLKGDNTGPVSAGIVLSNREVEVAVLETARGGLVRKGLGYDLADVAVVTNISEDHLGRDGIETLEDLAFVKSLVVESVKSEGYAVLNADDSFAAYLIERAVSSIFLFSKDKNNPLVRSHMKSGGKAIYVEENTVYIYNGKTATALIDLKDIPITFDGILECNIENSLAAAASLYALGLNSDSIRQGLATFYPDINSNPGRFNIFDMGNFKVMLDYSHNLAGYREVARFIEKLPAKRFVGVVGMPGDRTDSSIIEAARICGNYFEKIYIKEDNDLRGRAPGEVAGIFYDVVLKNGAAKENVEIIYSELKALEKAILDAEPGDFIVMFYEEFEPSFGLLNKLKDELNKNAIASDMIIQNVG